MRLQTGNFAGPLDCLKQTIRREGSLGFFKGISAPLTMSMLFNGLLFGTYESCKYFYPTGKGEAGKVLFAGGLAGVGYWIVIFPLDLVKSRIQVDDIKNPKYKGVFDCIKQSYKEGGIKTFYKGLSPSLFRAFPANAVTFATFEVVKELWNR